MEDNQVEPVAEPQVPQEAPEPEVPVEEPQPEVTETTEPEESTEEGKGAGQRIRELSHQTKVKDGEIRSLQDRIAELTGNGQPQGYQVPKYDPQEPLVQIGEEIDGNELNRRIAERDRRIIETANAQAQLTVHQSQATARHQSETAEVMRQFPQLDPKSKQFDKGLSNAVTKATASYLQAEPYTGSVKSFVSELMEPYMRSIEKGVGQVSENMAKQVSEAALRPTSVKGKEKGAAEKSIAELEAELGMVNS